MEEERNGETNCLPGVGKKKVIGLLPAQKASQYYCGVPTLGEQRYVENRSRQYVERRNPFV